MVNHRRRAILDAIEGVQNRLQSTDAAALQAWESQNGGNGQPQAAPPGTVAPVIAMQPREAVPLEVPSSAGIAESPTGPAPRPLPLPAVPLTGGVAPVAQGAIRDLSTEFQEQQARIDQLTGANQRLEQTLRQHKDQASGLQTQLTQAREAEQRLQAQLARTMQELQQAKSTGGDQVAKLESQLDVAVEELKKANADSAGILKALDEARKQIAELTAQKDELLRDRQGTMEEVAKVMAEANQAATDRDSARADRDKAKAERDEARKALEVAQADLAKLQQMNSVSSDGAQALERARGEVAVWQAKVVQLEQEARRGTGELKQRDELIKNLREELAGRGAMSEQNAKLLAELEKSQASIQQLNEQVERLEVDRSRLERENQALSKERDSLVAQRDQLQKDLDEMAILLNASDRVSGDIKDILAANQKWRHSLDEARAEISKLTEREGGYLNEIASLKGQLTSIQKERQSLQESNARYQKTVDELNGRLKEMLTQLDARTEQVTSLTKERDGLKSLLDQKDGLLARITGQLQESKAEASALANSKEENDLLRSLIRKQLVRQARLLEARDLVLAELRNVDVHSTQLLASLDEMSKPVIQLSDNEKAMFKEPEDLKLIAMTETGPEVPFSTLPVVPATSGTKVFASPGVSAKAAPAPAPAELVKKVPALAPYADVVILAKPQVDLAGLGSEANGQFRRGDFVAAARGYEEILRWDRTNEMALCNLAVIALRLGKLDEAEGYLKRARAKNPSYAPAHFHQGVLFYRRAKYDEALESFGQTVQLDSRNADAHNYLGLIASRKGWTTRAESEFKRALAINANHAEACFNLAVLYSTSKPPSRDQARDYYRRACKNGAERDPAIERFING
jgi:chromosome segregation ATPase/Flp pilus assembly protein TadD